MKLNTLEDLTLFRNCTILKIIELQSQNSDPELINKYSELLELSKSGDIENVREKLNSLIDEVSDFCKSFSDDTPVRDIAKNYKSLAKKILSQEQYEKIEDSFLPYSSDLNNQTYEEEPEEQISSDYSTAYMKRFLQKLHHLVHAHNPKTMSVSNFKNFATQFRDITLALGISKFQQYFDTQNKTIKDMKISFAVTPSQRPVYQTDFILSDSNSQQSHLSLEEPASTSGFSSTYYQNLCYSYLEANKYALIDENSLDPNIIPEKIATFRECYKKLDEMMKKSKITISNRSIIYSSESNIEPTELNLEACISNQSHNHDEIEI